MTGPSPEPAPEPTSESASESEPRSEPESEHAQTSGPEDETRAGRSRRRLVIAAIVLGAIIALLVVADVTTRIVAEHRVADNIRDENNAASVDVSFGGVSMLFNVLRGEIPSARIVMRDADVDGFRFELVDLDLDSIRFGRGLVVGGGGDIHIAGGDARITFSVDELNERLGPARGFVTFRPTNDGLDARVDVPIVGSVDVGVAIDVEDGTLIVGLDDVAVRGFGLDLPSLPRLRIRLPGVPASTTIEGRSVSGSNLTLDVRFGPFRVNSRGEIVNTGLRDPVPGTALHQAAA